MTTCTLAGLRNWLTKVIGWFRGRKGGRRPARQLRLCETLPLGERRFVAVIEFAQQKFLIGGTGQTLAMLAPLATTPATNPDKATQEIEVGALEREACRREAQHS
jgi:flagellar biogenesis protein FliO